MRSGNNKGQDQKSGNILSALLGILGTFIIIAVILCMIPLALPKLLGYATFNVVSGSMEPEIRVGSMVLVKEADPEEIAPGDVIAFRGSRDGSVVTHRVVANDTALQEFTTKGDANEQEDMEPVPYSSLIGRVERHYPAVGGLMAALTSGAGKISLLMILASGVLLCILSGRLKK